MSKPQVALVTGCSSGFGLLASVALAKAGLRVFASMRELGRSERLMTAAREADVSLELVKLDVTDARSIAGAVAEVTGKAGRIDVLVNNAGYGLGGFFADITDQEFRAQMETNFWGVIGTMKALLPQMMERRSGRIINVTSLNGRVGLPAVSAYCASKFAVEGLSESIRHELRPFDIHVSLIEPGTFKTDAFDRNQTLAKGSQDPSSPYYAMGQRILKMVGEQLAKSKADPADVARAIVRAATAKRPRLRYLVGTDARALTTLKSLLPFSALESLVGRMVGGVEAPLPPAAEPKQLAK